MSDIALNGVAVNVDVYNIIRPSIGSIING